MSKKPRDLKPETTICPECGSIVDVEPNDHYAICQMCGFVWGYTI